MECISTGAVVVLMFVIGAPFTALLTLLSFVAVAEFKRRKRTADPDDDWF